MTFIDPTALTIAERDVIFSEIVDTIENESGGGFDAETVLAIRRYEATVVGLEADARNAREAKQRALARQDELQVQVNSLQQALGAARALLAEPDEEYQTPAAEARE